MPILGLLGVIFLLAFLVESLTEYLFGQVFEHVPALHPMEWLLIYISAAVGVAGALVYQFDLLALLADYAGVNIVHSPFGVILTGLAIGRGANYLHDLVVKFFVKPSPSVGTPVPPSLPRYHV